MSSESDKLKAQAESINIAMESVLTEDQAKELVSGKIIDAFILKITVDIENRSGLLMAIVSTYRNEIIQMYSVFSASNEIKKVRTFEDVGQFGHDMVGVGKAGGVDRGLSESVGRAIYKRLNKTMIPSLLSFFESGDASKVVGLATDVVKNELKVKNVKAQADVEKMSSVKFRLTNPAAQELTPVIKPPDEVEGETAEPAEKSLQQKEMEALEKSYGRVVRCNTVLSPVAGVEFEELRENQKLLFQVPVENEEQKMIAKMMGAIDEEGNSKSIVGEFIKIYTGKNEYHIYAKGPGGALLKAFEEGRVKLAVPKVASAKTTAKNIQPEPAGNPMGMVIVVVLVILFILLGVILFV